MPFYFSLDAPHLGEDANRHERYTEFRIRVPLIRLLFVFVPLRTHPIRTRERTQ